jgi:hypothetical protein
MSTPLSVFSTLRFVGAPRTFGRVVVVVVVVVVVGGVPALVNAEAGTTSQPFPMSQ